MQIGIIGAGKVGTTLAKYVKDHGACVTGFYSRTESSGRESAEFTGTEYFETLDSLIRASDIGLHCREECERKSHLPL